MAPIHKLPSTRQPSLTFARWWGKYQYRTGFRLEQISSFRYRHISPMFEHVPHKAKYYTKQYLPFMVGFGCLYLFISTLDKLYIEHHREEWP